MPLSPAVQREAIHQRDIECHGYRRADGLWDVEGRMVDTKTYAFDNRYRGQVDPSLNGKHFKKGQPLRPADLGATVTVTEVGDLRHRKPEPAQRQAELEAVAD